MSARCTTCTGPLDVAATLCDSDVCTSCESRRIRLAVDPWQTFLRVLRSKVRADGTVHVNDCRECLRGRVEPKQVGLFFRRAKSMGLLAGGNEWEPSTDERGANQDKQARIWRAGPKLRSDAA